MQTDVVGSFKMPVKKFNLRNFTIQEIYKKIYYVSFLLLACNGYNGIS